MAQLAAATTRYYITLRMFSLAHAMGTTDPMFLRTAQPFFLCGLTLLLLWCWQDLTSPGSLNSYTHIDPADYPAGLISDPGSGASYLSSNYVPATSEDELNHNWDQDAEEDDNADGEDDEEEAPAPAPAAIEDLTAGPMSDKPSTVATESPSDKRAVVADLTASPVRMVWSQRTSRKRNRPSHPNDKK